MQRRSSPNFLFVFLVFLSVSFYFLDRTGSLGFLERGLQPLQKSIFGVFSFSNGIGRDQELKNLKDENLALSKKLLDQKKIEADIDAFRNQFETESVRSNILLPSEILGIKGFIPNVTPPEFFVLDKGRSDNVKNGDAVVFEDNFIGKIERVSVYQARVLLPTNSAFSIPAKTQNGVLGVVKGQGGGEMILDNVLVSEKINAGDFVLSAPDVDFEGGGASPNLIIGKIISIEKKSGDLFQKARVKSLTNYASLTRVFILKETR